MSENKQEPNFDNESQLEQRLRRFYQPELNEPGSKADFWQKLESRLSQDNIQRTIKPLLPDEPLATKTRWSNHFMEKLVEKEKVQPDFAQTNIMPLSAKKRPQGKAGTVLAALVATILVAFGLVSLAVIIAGQSESKSEPAQLAGSEVLTVSPNNASTNPSPTSNQIVTIKAASPGSSLTSSPVTQSTAGPIKPNTDSCGQLNSFDCAFRQAGLEYIVANNLGQQPEQTQTQGDYTVTLKRVAVDKNLVIVGYTVRGPADAATKTCTFHPESIKLTDAQGNALTGAPYYADGPEGSDEQGFVVSWQLPSRFDGKEVKLNLTITDILVLGPPSLSSPRTPTPGVRIYAKGPFIFELSVPA